jgi:hypothetical protein
MTLYANCFKMTANKNYIPFYRFINQIYYRQNIRKKNIFVLFSKLYISLNLLFVLAVWTRLNSVERSHVKKILHLCFAQSKNSKTEVVGK